MRDESGNGAPHGSAPAPSHSPAVGWCRAGNARCVPGPLRGKKATRGTMPAGARRVKGGNSGCGNSGRPQVRPYGALATGNVGPNFLFFPVETSAIIRPHENHQDSLRPRVRAGRLARACLRVRSARESVTTASAGRASAQGRDRCFCARAGSACCCSIQPRRRQGRRDGIDVDQSTGHAPEGRDHRARGG